MNFSCEGEIRMKEVIIKTDFIKLEQFLKYEGLSSTGGEAKNVIMDGLVKVNGNIETARGKKLKSGDIIEFMNDKYKIV